MGIQNKKKNTVAKKVAVDKNTSLVKKSDVKPELLLPPGTDCVQHIRSIFNRDFERTEAITKLLPDRVLIELTSDVLKSPDMYPKVVTDEDRVVMGTVERAALRVRRELFVVRVSRDVQDFIRPSLTSTATSEQEEEGGVFLNLAPKAVGLATLLAEGMRGSFVFTNWFVEMLIRSGTTTKEELMSLTSSDRVRIVAIGMYVFIRATHEVYGNERLYFPGNLLVTLRYMYGMFYSPTGSVGRNGNVYCAAACLLVLGTFSSREVPAALDEICIPLHERCVV